MFNKTESFETFLLDDFTNNNLIVISQGKQSEKMINFIKKFNNEKKRVVDKLIVFCMKVEKY